MSGVEIRLTGALLTGRAPAVIETLCREAARDVAAQGRADVHQNLDRSIRRPTPYYETQINSARVGPTAYLVNDRNVVYGPWLEGTSSRNRTTRFKGYAAFRRARAALGDKVPNLVAGALARAVRGLGG